MKKLLLLLSFLSFLYLHITAQINLPLVYEIKTDTALEQDLDSNYYQVLSDKEGKLTFKDVASPSFTNKFFYHSVQQIKSDKANAVEYYWFRYRYKNATNHKINISLDSWADETDFYVLDSTNKWQHYKTGHIVPWSKKDGFKNNNMVPVELAPNETILIYCRYYYIKAEFNPDLKIDFEGTYKFALQQVKDDDTNTLPKMSFGQYSFLGFMF